MIATLVGVLQQDGMDENTPNNSGGMEMHEFASENSQKAHFHRKTQVKQDLQVYLLFSEAETC